MSLTLANLIENIIILENKNYPVYEVLIIWFPGKYFKIFVGSYFKTYKQCLNKLIYDIK